MKNEDYKFKVLFVCTRNAYRSPICEALLKKLRADLELDSPRTRIASKIPKEAREYLMSKSAMQYLKKKPESIDSSNWSSMILLLLWNRMHRDSVLKKCPECKEKL